MSDHEHTFVFLRQEEIPTHQWGDRIHEWLIRDVFYCQACLRYDHRPVRREEPDGYHRRVIWRVTE